jgi:hypothetical protein
VRVAEVALDYCKIYTPSAHVQDPSTSETDTRNGKRHTSIQQTPSNDTQCAPNSSHAIHRCRNTQDTGREDDLEEDDRGPHPSYRSELHAISRLLEHFEIVVVFEVVGGFFDFSSGYAGSGWRGLDLLFFGGGHRCDGRIVGDEIGELKLKGYDLDIQKVIWKGERG